MVQKLLQLLRKNMIDDIKRLPGMLLNSFFLHTPCSLQNVNSCLPNGLSFIIIYQTFHMKTIE